jgi:hypothetical protein
MSKRQSDYVHWYVFIALLIAFFALVALMRPSTDFDEKREHRTIPTQNATQHKD